MVQMVERRREELISVKRSSLSSKNQTQLAWLIAGLVPGGKIQVAGYVVHLHSHPLPSQVDRQSNLASDSTVAIGNFSRDNQD
jgi:hypothetical protein